MLKIEGQLFQIGTVVITEAAKEQARFLQARLGHKGDEAVSVHCSVLLKLHATGQFGDIVGSDKKLNMNNIKKGQGRVLSVIGQRHTFLIMTEVESGDTLICTPSEV